MEDEEERWTIGRLFGPLFPLPLPRSKGPFVTGNQELCDVGLGAAANSQRELSEFSCLRATV